MQDRNIFGYTALDALLTAELPHCC